ncbi:MAG: hypothetical protein E6Q27_01370 [Aeromicrobium sp.]|nr:MAG: hypothetical protein E6Q27_01370 [Aeromicrobium sp.]
MPSEAQALDHLAAWNGRAVLVAGLGAAGLAAADALHHVGAKVTAIDAVEISPDQRERAQILTYLGVDIRIDSNSDFTLPAGIDHVVVAHERYREAPFVEQALDQGMEVLGDIELAWRLRGPDAAPWIVIAGDDHGHETALVLEQILTRSGVRALAVGADSRHSIEAVLDPEGPAVLIVTVSRHQALWLRSVSAYATAVTDIDSEIGAPDDWANVYERTLIACVYNEQDTRTRTLVENADVVEGARAIGFSVAAPGLSMIGIVEDVVVDRAFGPDRKISAEELFTLGELTDISRQTLAPVLAASALARSLGVPAQLVRTGIVAG